VEYYQSLNRNGKLTTWKTQQKRKATGTNATIQRINAKIKKTTLGQQREISHQIHLSNRNGAQLTNKQNKGLNEYLTKIQHAVNENTEQTNPEKATYNLEMKSYMMTVQVYPYIEINKEKQ